MKKLILTTVFLSLAFALAVASLFSDWDAKLQSQHDDHLYRLERFLDDAGKTPKGVVVGTSLGARLGLEQGKNGVYDLCLSGGSIYTGLEMIISSGRKPGVVFIETNLIDKDGDERMITEASNNWGRYLQVFRTRYSPINVFCSFLARVRPPAPFVSNHVLVASGIAGQLDKYNHPIDNEVLSKKLDQLKSLVSSLEKTGSHVVFYEMPISAELERSSRVQQIRSVIAQSFPTHRHIIFRSEQNSVVVETTDGTHLSSRDVSKIRPVLEKEIADAVVRLN